MVLYTGVENFTVPSLAATVGIEVVTNFPLPNTNPGPALYVGGRRGLIRPARWASISVD